MYRSATTHIAQTNRRNFVVRNSHGQRGQVTVAIYNSWAIPDAEFSAVQFCSYTVRRTQYNRPS